MILKVVPESFLCRAKDLKGTYGSWISEWALFKAEYEGEQN